jgi:hypothetical protein
VAEVAVHVADREHVLLHLRARERAAGLRLEEAAEAPLLVEELPAERDVADGELVALLHRDRHVDEALVG